MTNFTVQRSRIDLVDALRGFALMGIILLHNIEHFDIANIVVSSPVLQPVDNFLHGALFFLFGGKAYAMFALLFGFSFYIQFENQRKKGNSYAGRFAWRMVLLFGFGVFHVLFYSGEILSCYALAGLFIILFRNLSNRILLLLAIICLLEPWELGKLMYMLANPSYIPDIPDWKYYERAVEAATQSNSIFEVMKVNLTAGMANAHLFAWRSGRYFQTVALFMLGLILGRKSLFIQSESSNSFWKKAFFFSIPAFIILYLVQRKVNSLTGQSALQQPLSTLCSMWENFAFMTFLVSSFVLLWFNSGVKSLLAKLIPYGRMSLSNYITCSIIGSFLYYNYGLGLWDKLGTTYSLLVGITIFTIQVLVSKWWLKKHRQGPLEKLWYKLTWIGRNNLKNHN